MKLIVFDMDQTLVNFVPVQAEAVRQTFVRFFNVEANLHEIDWDGKGMMDTFAELARVNNVPEDLYQLNKWQVREGYIDAFVSNFPLNAADCILPGIGELLHALSKADNVLVLYTFASRQIVDKVLEGTGLGRFFAFCFYGTEVGKRSDMVGLAIEKAAKLTGQLFQDGDVVIIGDSLADIDAGKPFNALNIGVATGYRTEDVLAKAGADFVFKDLGDYSRVIEAIDRGKKIRGT